MSIFAIGQDYRNTLIFNHMADFLFEQVTKAIGVVRFVQVGANDGCRGDPVHRFVRSGQWRGVLVEPIPEVFARLQASLASVDGLQFANYAIGPADGTARFYAVAGPASTLSGFNRAHIIKYRDWVLSMGLPAPETCIEEITVRVSTLESLCREFGLGEIDVLVSDTEGFDCKVIRSMDLEARHPILIYFEHWHCPSEETLDVRNLLISLGYDIFFDSYNAMAVRCDSVLSPSMIKLFREVLVDASNMREQIADHVALAEPEWRAAL